MSLRRVCAVTLATAAVAALAGPAAAGPRHWFYDSYGAYERGAVIDFGFWAGPRPWAPRYYAPPPRRRQAAYPPLYPGERPVRPELYYEVAPGEFVPIYGNSGDEAPALRAYGDTRGYRQAPVAPAIKPQRRLTDVPTPRPKPTVPQKLATTAPAPTIVETDTPADKVSGAPISCDKARRIVSGFGFSDIRTLGCSGNEYGFSAKRDGKDFEIKLSSLTGELVQVKRR